MVAYIPRSEPIDLSMLVPMKDIDFSVERKGNAVIVRKHYPHYSLMADSRLAPAVRVYPTRDDAVYVFQKLERNGHRACQNFYYKTRQEWQDREQVSAWTERPSAIEVPGQLRAS